VGPFQSGKTTLLEAILARTGTIGRQGTVEAGTTVGDASKEARHHAMSVELSVATADFMGDTYTFIDCPGSVEFVHDMRAALPVVDAAVVVCEADEKKIPQLQLILRELEDLKIPRFLFLNKIDKADKRVRETLALLQPASRVPLLLRQIPIWSGEIITGFTDLALERAFVYKEHAPSEVIELKGDDLDREKEARFVGLETPARRAGMPGADRDRHPRQRGAPAAEGIASRVACGRRYHQAARPQGRPRSRRLCPQDVPHRPRRQDVGRARAQWPGR
jgi:elongation factor G